MQGYRSISPYDFEKSAFSVIDKDWLLITTENHGKGNAMTASWGGMGILWNKPVIYLVVRPQRYTRELLDEEGGRLSVCVLDDAFRKELGYLGTASGRDEDKLAHTGLTLSHEDGYPYLAQAHTVFLCSAAYRQPLEGRFFLKEEYDKACYPDKDYHILYIVEVDKLFVKK